MLNHIIRFFKFLMPILGKASLQVAADTLSDAAYPGPRRPRPLTPYRPYTSYARIPQPRTYGTADYSHLGFRDRYADSVDENTGTSPGNDPTESFHDVLLVAFDLRGPNAKAVHQWLQEQMPDADADHVTADGTITLDSWWVANDDRFDRSVCDSAVFVSKGNQALARDVLRRERLVS